MTVPVNRGSATAPTDTPRVAPDAATTPARGDFGPVRALWAFRRGRAPVA